MPLLCYRDIYDFAHKTTNTSCVLSVLSVILHINNNTFCKLSDISVILQSFPCFWFSACLHPILVFRDTYHTVKTLSAKSTWKFTFLHIFVDTIQIMARYVVGVFNGVKA